MDDCLLEYDRDISFHFWAWTRYSLEQPKAFLSSWNDQTLYVFRLISLFKLLSTSSFLGSPLDHAFSHRLFCCTGNFILVNNCSLTTVKQNGREFILLSHEKCINPRKSMCSLLSVLLILLFCDQSDTNYCSPSSGTPNHLSSPYSSITHKHVIFKEIATAFIQS